MMHYLTPKQPSSCTGYTKLATYGNKLGFSFKIFQGREKQKMHIMLLHLTLQEIFNILNADMAWKKKGTSIVPAFLISLLTIIIHLSVPVLYSV